MTFEQIAKANETIRTTNIKGKEYAEVNQRIKAFRMLYPDGSITTELISDTDGRCIFKATISDGNGRVLGTGTAFELQASSFINKTSYIENCETSAVGRALAMCGIGIDTSVASYEEVANAMENQDMKALPIHEEPKKGKASNTSVEPTVDEVAKKLGTTREEMIEVAKAHYPEGSKQLAALLATWNIDSIDNASTAQLMAVWSKYNKK